MLFDKVFILVCCILFHVNGEESQCTSDTTQLLELKYVNASTSAEMLLSWGISSVRLLYSTSHYCSYIHTADLLKNVSSLTYFCLSIVSICLNEIVYI